MIRQPLRPVVVEAERLLAEAGVDSPRADAELLAAHVLGVGRGRLPLVPGIGEPEVERLRELVRRRAERVPLQHVLGWAPMGAITVAVGPGVFVPRPETELLAEWGLARLKGLCSPVVVDLCTGSGVLALTLANARPDAVVHAVERDDAALSWARRNADDRAGQGDTPVHLHRGDVTDPELLTELDGAVDLVVCNPPYVPDDTPVQPEVADHDPSAAVFGGADGLDVIRHVVVLAARLLRPGGHLAVEHDDTQGESVPALLRAHGAYADVEDHEDLAARPRYATARRELSVQAG
jgi:release factor glutamine methyltransferase